MYWRRHRYYGLGQEISSELTEFWVRRHNGHYDAYCLLTFLPGTSMEKKVEFFDVGLTPSDAVANLLFRICEEGNDIESPKWIGREGIREAFRLVMEAFEELVRTGVM
ncbi:hypothetical protein DRO54_10100 [Candidatus Bathyarchaeota archaeon]|nr:MAG: hypothetical protein DRO54_10100 [Candidatus Bathyarchaeota archaeon]